MCITVFRQVVYAFYQNEIENGLLKMLSFNISLVMVQLESFIFFFVSLITVVTLQMSLF